MMLCARVHVDTGGQLLTAPPCIITLLGQASGSCCQAVLGCLLWFVIMARERVSCAEGADVDQTA
jgi:hypothetical protein